MLERVAHVGDWGPFTAIGLERDGELVAGVVYNHFTGPSVMTSIAVDGRLTRGYLGAIFRYPFVQLGVRRLTACIEPRNTRSLRFVQHLGFKQEGVLRHGSVADDLIVLGMLRDECRYLEMV